MSVNIEQMKGGEINKSVVKRTQNGYINSGIFKQMRGWLHK